MSFKRFFSSFWADDRGQSTTEYILILSVVVMIALKFKGMIGEQLERMVQKVGGQMNEVAGGS